MNTVNALAAGAIETELVMKMYSAKTREVYRRGIPLDRYSSPAESAAAAVFLASPEAAYITGEVLADALAGTVGAGRHDAKLYTRFREVQRSLPVLIRRLRRHPSPLQREGKRLEPG